MRRRSILQDVVVAFSYPQQRATSVIEQITIIDPVGNKLGSAAVSSTQLQGGPIMARIEDVLIDAGGLGCGTNINSMVIGEVGYEAEKIFNAWAWVRTRYRTGLSEVTTLVAECRHPPHCQAAQHTLPRGASAQTGSNSK